MFDQRYQVVIADTEEAKRLHYRLRYEVYCLDKGFEPPEKFANELETDQYDNKAIHFIVMDQRTSDWVGAMRLIVSDLDQLPLNNVAQIDKEKVRHTTSNVAELSRLAIVDRYRNGQNSSMRDEAKYSQHEIFLGLLRAAKTYCESMGINHWIFLCARALARIMKTCGMTLHRVGPACQHKGVRYPYWMNIMEEGFSSLHNASNDVNTIFSQPQNQSFLRYSELYRAYPMAA